MTTGTKLTLEFRGVEANLLEELINSGLYNTKSEAIRAALVHYGNELGLINRQKLWQEITSAKRRNVSPEQLKKDLEKLEDET
ncbi:hypothetical protein HY837_06590 [archaeon]|nr:hypothetical protein [archaeon]